jgi:3-(3-hydroxy-phenyl)propionate hydroxylase
MPMSPLRRRWEFMLKPDEAPEAMLDDAKIAELLMPWTKPGQVELVRKAVYRFHGLVAKTWRNKSVLLAGDSARANAAVHGPRHVLSIATPITSPGN